MLLLVSEKKPWFFKSMIFSSHFNILTYLQRSRFLVDKLSWNFLCKVEMELQKSHYKFWPLEGHKICWKIKTILQFMACNISIDFGKPQNMFSQKQGVVS